jgi:tetratricopeptide (TPR) repeat protein
MIRLLVLAALSVSLLAGEPSDKPKAKGDQPELIPQISGVVLDVPPFRFSTDVGASDKERKEFARRILKPMLETTEYFLKVYGLRPRTFEDYAEHYSGNNFEKLVRVAVWADYETFRENFQRRYETKTIPGAFFGVAPDKDAYGKETGAWIREIATSSEGAGDEQLLRHLYHEMGHLFMKTYIVVQVEVPSWIEEGTAELFQYRVGNGTKPEAERLQRQGWLMEIISEGSAIPFSEFVNVKNLDNLDFTWKDPLRSTLQYAQAWSVIEFMIANPQRANAFMKMLAEFKARGEKRQMELAGQGLRGESLSDKLRPHLYEIQIEVVKKCYGSDLIKVEDNWKDWLTKLYEKELSKKPAIRYHRGEWRLIRARHVKTREEAEAHLARAEEIFTECMEKAPDSPEGWVGMGRIHLIKGEHDQAWPMFTRALEKGSDNMEAMLYGGIARVQRGQAEGAVEPLSKVVAERPNAFDANYWYGIALVAARGDTERAVAAFSTAGGVEKERAGECSWYEGVAHLVGGRQRPARLALLRSLGQPGVPEHAALWLAYVMALDGERAEAIEMLAKSPASPDKDVLAKRLADNNAAMPAIVSDERGRPKLDDAGNYTPVESPKGKGKPKKK